MVLLVSVLFPIIMGFVLLLSGTANRRLRELWVVGTAVITAALAIGGVAASFDETTAFIRFTDTMSFAFRADGLGSVFAVMVSVLWVIASVYALEYMKHEGAETRFFGFFLISFGVTLGVAFAANLITMYLFYELLTLSTLPLVMHKMDGKARYAGKSYILYSMTGAGLGFAAMVFLLYYGVGDFTLGGSLSSEAFANGENLVLLVYVMGFFGFGVKAAVWPFHRWLLDASVAPTPVTALLHAVAVVKAGVFAVMRLTYYAFGPECLSGTWAQVLVMSVAALTVVYGSFRSLRSVHFKRRLAYSTISNLSYILVGVATMSHAGLIAAVAHMVFHAVNKICLFFGCGAVYYRTNKEYVYELDGIGKTMPVTMLSFTVTALGLIGIPPFTAFISKWRIATAALSTGMCVGWVGAASLAVSAFLTAVYMMTIIFPAYMPRKGRGPVEIKNQDPNWMMKGPLLVLMVMSLLLPVGAHSIMDWVASLMGI